MPCAIFGENSICLPKSAGASSIQTLSSFCHSVSAPSIFLASLMTLAKVGGCPGCGAAAPGPEAGRAALAAAIGDEAAAPGAAAVPAGAVAQPAAAKTHTAAKA